MDKGLLLNIINIVASTTSILLSILTWGMIIYILSSWIPPLRESSFGEILGKIYEPILEPFRKLIPPLGGMLDLSPIIVLIVLRFFNMGLMAIFERLADFIILY